MTGSSKDLRQGARVSELGWMGAALEQAQTAGPECAPNPRVGCVLVDQNNQLIGAGRTQAVGGPHAEVMALRDAAARGFAVTGATAYVTLEPCAHHGRTGPCCDALIDAGVRKVVASLEDPNPLVSGAGFARLRAAGIEVEIGPGGNDSRELNLGFISRMVRKRPWVRMKVAASLDGQTALQNGESQWITSEEARADGHAWRARAGAVLTGIGTVLSDDPKLDVRAINTPRQPDVVVVDSNLCTPPNASIFVAERRVYIYTGSQSVERKSVLEQLGATVVDCPDHASITNNQVDLRKMLFDLAQREINELHVEAGATLNGAMLDAGLVDEVLLFVAPKWIGPGRGLSRMNPIGNLHDAIELDIRSVDAIGSDLRIVARVKREQH